MDTVMTMEVHALTGMLTNHGAQMVQMVQMIFGVDQNINGAMLTLVVTFHYQLFTSKILNMKVNSNGKSARPMFADVSATTSFQMIS
tara:strand:- start:92 stop:352 length:261 start_codon:yes stop_codon:yes gene_type:complete